MAEDAKKRCWIGFDLGGTKILSVVFDSNLKPLGRKRKKTRAREGEETGVERIITTIEKSIEDAGIDRDDLAGIGIGCPGPVNMDKGILHDTPNLGWGDLKLGALLKDAFGCPCYPLNDVDAGVYGEYVAGAAQDARCVVGAFPGTGIGGGCVHNGKVLSGAGLSCFEIGHMQVQPDGPLCGCGQRGCLEAVASRLAIASAAAAAAFRGEAPALLKNAGTDVSNIRSGALADSVKNGDRVVEDIIRTAARRLGTALASVVDIIAPDVILLGGGLVEAMPELYRTEVETAARARVMPPFRKTFKVVVAELGDDASVTGAAAWARARVGEPPTGKGRP